MQRQLYTQVTSHSKRAWNEQKENREKLLLKKENGENQDPNREEKSDTVTVDTATSNNATIVIEDDDDDSHDNRDDDHDEKKGKKKKSKNNNPTFNLQNILMQLRKAALHPLLLRNLYDNEKVKAIAQILKRHHEDYRDEPLNYIIEDLSLHSDYQLHQMCLSFDKLEKFALSQDKIFETSGKFLVLKKLLKELVEKGSRILIFSQFTMMLDILEPFLDHLGLKYLRLDGQSAVSDRQDLIDDFNEKDIPIFLLSTKAGGVGINLTAADVAIFYDISFNYQVERQAEDRCHRLGQEKEVTVYKLIMNNTVEESILQMAESKKHLNDAVLEEGSYTEKDGSDTKIILKLFQTIFKEES